MAGTQSEYDGDPEPHEKETLNVNLSSRRLTDLEIKVLEKGLGYVPTPKRDHFQEQCELQQFFHKVRLKAFFNETPQIQMTDSGLHNASTFTPHNGMIPNEVLTFEQAVLKDI